MSVSSINITCKVILTVGNVENGHCVYSSDITKTESPDIYYIPSINIYIDKMSYDIFRKIDNRVFVAVQKNEVINDNPVYALSVLKKNVYNKYKKKKIKKADIDMKYETPQVIGEGAYGKVEYFPTEDIVVKTSKNVEEFSIPYDMVKEMAIYNLFGKITCMPKMFGISLEPNIQLRLEKGAKTLSQSLKKNELSYDEKKFFISRLSKCMRAIASQGIINCDLKPANMIITNSGNIQIIDWGASFIDTSYMQQRDKTILTTLWYRSPEVFLQHKKCSNKVDIFALGLIFAEIYTNVPVICSKDDGQHIYGMLRILLGIPRNELHANTEKNLEVMKAYVQDDNKNAYLQIKENLLSDKFKNERDGQMPEDLRDLISKMLVFNPDIRISYDEIITHPYFQNTNVNIPKLPIFIGDMPIISNLNYAWAMTEDMNFRMRGMAIDWLFYDVVKPINISNDSLFLSIQLLDLLVIKKHPYIKRTLLQAYACICLLLSTLVYDSKRMRMKDVLYVCNNQYTKEQLFDIEKKIIIELEGDFIVPSLYTYLNHYNKTIDTESLVKKYMSDDIYTVPFNVLYKSF